MVVGISRLPILAAAHSRTPVYEDLEATGTAEAHTADDMSCADANYRPPAGMAPLAARTIATPAAASAPIGPDITRTVIGGVSTVRTVIPITR